jgi:hypothetical protein
MADKYLSSVLMGKKTYNGRKSHSKIWLCSSGVYVFGTAYATTKITALNSITVPTRCDSFILLCFCR